MISNAFQSFAVATECLARRQEDLTYEELADWAAQVAVHARRNLALNHSYGDNDEFDHLRGFNFRTKHA